MLGRWVISNSSTPSASSAPLRAACRSSLRSGGTQAAHERLETQEIALGAKAGHHPERQIRNHRASALGLPGEDVRQMHLDKGDLNREQRITQRQARVGERGGV